jgi:hypothetical protein
MRVCGGKCFGRRVAAGPLHDICPGRKVKTVVPSRLAQVVEGFHLVLPVLLLRSRSTDIDNNEESCCFEVSCSKFLQSISHVIQSLT